MELSRSYCHGADEAGIDRVILPSPIGDFNAGQVVIPKLKPENW